MASVDDMPRLVDDDEYEDEDMQLEEFLWLTSSSEPENSPTAQQDKGAKLFGGLPLTYEDLLANEPEPLSELCTVTLVASMNKEKKKGAGLVAMEKCKNSVNARATLGLLQGLHETVLRRFSQAITPVGRQQLPT